MIFLFSTVNSGEKENFLQANKFTSELKTNTFIYT